MRTAVVVDAIRTPIGKASSESGYFRNVRADDLSAGIMRALVERTGVDPHLIDDIRWGCVMQQGEQGIDIARIAGLIAGCRLKPAVSRSTETALRVCRPSMIAR